MNLEWFRNKSNQHLSIILAFVLIAGTCFMLGKSYSDTKTSSKSPVVSENSNNSETINQIEAALSPTATSDTANNTAVSNSGSGSSSTKATASFPVNINTATVTELDAIPYIGEVKAKAIVDYRSSKGPFQSVQELVNVKGIGPATLNKIKDKITI